jgi:hypothetical protein
MGPETFGAAAMSVAGGGHSHNDMFTWMLATALCGIVGGPGNAQRALVEGTVGLRFHLRSELSSSSRGAKPNLRIEKAELRSCPGTKQVAIVVALSPKDTTDGVWKALRATAGALVCN